MLPRRFHRPCSALLPFLSLVASACASTAKVVAPSAGPTMASEPDAEASPVAAIAEPPPPTAAAPAPPAVVARAAESEQAMVGVTNAAPREMLDIEANLTLRVAKVRPSLHALHELAARVGGTVTSERVEKTGDYSSAQLTLRVPSGATQGVFDELERLGNVLDQNLVARDVGKEYFDASVRLSSLEATLKRYTEILARANTVEEVLRIEAELARIRSEIEQVKGNLRFLADRSARATLHIALREQPLEIVQPPPEPDAKVYPGLRLPTALDFGKYRTDVYVGAGFSLSLGRIISFDLDILKRPTSAARGPDAMFATVGGEVYSELSGGGRRRWLNPYLGWRVGYARFDSDGQALAGGTLGIELFKSRFFVLDAEARNYFAFGKPRGSHYVLEPAIAARIAF